MNKTNNLEKKKIPIVFGLDDNFIPFFCVAVNSIIKNSNRDYFYDIYLFHSGISKKTINELKVNDSNDYSISFINVADKMRKIKNNVCVRNQYSDAIYLRFFIPEVLTKYDKVIYLDADVIVNGDISKLYNIDLEDYLVGAVADEVVKNSDLFIQYVEKYLNVNSTKYFNSGVMLINSKKFRDEKIFEVFSNMSEEIRFEVAPDQDYLNVICKDKVLYLNQGWNKMPIQNYEFSNSDLNLIHFNLNLKPWRYDGILYEDYFWEQAKNSRFYNKILSLKENFNEEQKKSADEHSNNLVELAKSCVLNAEGMPSRIYGVLNGIRKKVNA